ncbi:MAG TPA: glycosyltransferase family 2 protein [Gemmatimonadaceae bacterium]|nr:glycosyltransferase family 2 protein [Gemmatimonadaceae bacterium]
MFDALIEGLTYILPIKSLAPPTQELLSYFQALVAMDGVELIVVDGSLPEIFEMHSKALAGFARHVIPDPDLSTPMGKVGGVLTGVRLASHERMIIADDDVRYDQRSLSEVRDQLLTADVVRPQNFFDPLPFHAIWDTGRILLNRISGGDWPGTLGVRRSALRRTDGYDGNAMFENLELVRTVVASGGTEVVRPDVYVKRRPSTARHFWSQRVRQAYDEIARPARLAWQLAILPLVLLLAFKGMWLVFPVAVAAIVVAAEIGRRRDFGAAFFPASASILAPAWILERAICSWLAVGARVFLGGVPYRGRILRHAATPMHDLRARFSTVIPLDEPSAAQRRSA